MCPIDNGIADSLWVVWYCSSPVVEISALGQFWRRGRTVYCDVYCVRRLLYIATYCLEGVSSELLLAAVQKRFCLHNDNLCVCLISDFRGVIVFCVFWTGQHVNQCLTRVHFRGDIMTYGNAWKWCIA